MSVKKRKKETKNKDIIFPSETEVVIRKTQNGIRKTKNKKTFVIDYHQLSLFTNYLIDYVKHKGCNTHGKICVKK